MDIEFSEAAEIDVEVQALNLDGIKQNLLDYVQNQAKIDIVDSVDKADKSAQSAETYAAEAAVSATAASACAEQTSENLGLYYKKNETDTLLNGKADVATTLSGYGITDGANTALSNLNSDGQMVIDSQNGTISNCVLEIPQNLKIEASGTTISIKAGSIITKTGNTYSTITLTSDLTKTNFNLNANSTYVVFTNNNGVSFAWKKIEKVGSGSSLPADNTDYDDFFLTTDKIIYTWSSGSWSSSDITYPVCVVVTDGSGNISFAKDSNGNDMIFNGAGFIGHHAFVFPNVKGLWANGKDVDGVLKSGNAGQSSLKIFEMASGQQVTGINRCIGLMDIAGTGTSAGLWRGYAEVDTPEDLNTTGWVYVRQYVKSENRIYQMGSVLETGVANCNGTPLIEYFYNGTTVTDFTIRQPYQGARNLLTDDLYKQIGDVETLLATV